MNENRPKMDPKAKAIVILFLLLIIGVVIGFVISHYSLESIDKRTKATIVFFKGDFTLKQLDQLNTPQARAIWESFKETYTLVTIVICLNLALLIGLLGVYYDGFRKTKSNFTLGLFMFLGVLFIQAFLSLPVIQLVLGQSLSDLGLFHIVPNFFETIALIIFFYLSTE